MDKSKNYNDRPWLNNYSKEVPSTITYSNIILSEFLQISLKKTPKKTALIYEGYKVNFEELNNMVNRFANCLIDFGVEKGDSVAIVLPNSIHFVVSFLAIIKTGAIAVVNNPALTGRELEQQFNDAKVKILVTQDIHVNRMIDQRSQMSYLKQIIYISLDDYLPLFQKIPFINIRKKSVIKKAPDVYKWKELIIKYKPEPREVIINFDDIAMYQYTSGTTGIAKGVTLTHGNISKQLQQLMHWFPDAGDDETMLGVIPFFNISGLTTVLCMSMSSSWTLVIMSEFNTQKIIEMIYKYKISIVSLVPTMYINLLNHPELNKNKFMSVKTCISGGDSIPVDIIKDFEKKTNSIILEGYGLTETSPVTHMNPYNGNRKIGSIGLPIPDTECLIVDWERGDNVVSINEPGELLVKGPQIMKEYLNKENETMTVLKDGWLYTGDIATMDEDGYFYLVDRKHDVIISNGYYVYPREIEEVFYEYNKILEVCAIGIRHPSRGEAPIIFVVLKDGETANESDILNFCKGKLAEYKIPIRVEFRKELPKSNSGKVLRRILKSSIASRIKP